MEKEVVILLLVTLMYTCNGQGSESGDQCSTVNIYTELKELRSLVQGLTTRLDATQAELEQERAARKVAFSAAILGPNRSSLHHGPFNVETNLIFPTVITNLGSAYNADTGIFTAPVKGLYYFRYSGRAFSSENMGLSIFKGSTHIVASYNYKSSGDGDDTVSNGVVLELEVGDPVFMRLWINSWISTDDRYKYCTFSGFLLTPL
ncbi:complement C1q-like protein 4 [Engraulis encrasicolus]|uniref:complement C1q-like protein 4 n=1 Tax=Engraulis encrasicolus TaxID=184585 RepID=UPI002FD6D36F